MGEPRKKISIPENLDDSVCSLTSQAPVYFIPGTILSGISESEKNIVSENVSNTKHNENSNFDTVKTISLEIPSKSSLTASRSKESTSRFENEFSNLRESKFFNKLVDISSESSTAKLHDKCRNFSSLLVNPRQRGNPLLKHIRNVPWEFTEIEPDYIMGKVACALFLSLRYHNLFPNYIHERLKALGKSYDLRVLLVQVDVADPNTPLKDLSVISILADCTLMVAWSSEEAGNYLETYKMFENKSADLIKEKQGTGIYSQLIDCLTMIRSVNKTDAMVLLSNFKTLKGLIQASVEELAQCPGIGPLKAKRIYDALRKPLKNTKS